MGSVTELEQNVLLALLGSIRPHHLLSKLKPYVLSFEQVVGLGLRKMGKVLSKWEVVEMYQKGTYQEIFVAWHFN